MPQPTRSQVHVNRPLTNISIAFLQDQNVFIADKVFPVVPVQKKSNNYFSYPREYWFKSEAKKRAPGTESAGSGLVINSDNLYNCDPYAVHTDISDQIRDNADSPLNLDRDATQWVTHQLLIKREKIWVNDFFKPGIWTIEYTGVSSSPTGNQFLQWDQANSTPIKDITNRVTGIAELTGFKPNVLVLSPYVFNVLKNHPNIVDRIKYTQRGIVTADMMAALFDVDRVEIAWGVENSANEGVAGDFNFMFGKHALLAYSNPTPSIMQPSAGYTFSWSGFVGGQDLATRIKNFRMEHLNSDRIEGEFAMDMKVVSSDLATFFIDAVS